MLLNPKQPTRASALGDVVICSKKTVCLEKTSLPRLRSLKNEQAHSPSSFHTKVPGQTMLRVVVLWACVAASLAWVNTLISSSPAPPLTLMTDEGVQGYISRYPSGQGLVYFCAEVLRINISPFLPKQLPERSSVARRSLSELNSVEMSPVAESSQCWVCGSPMGNRGRCQRRLPSTNNFCLSHDVSRSSSHIILGEPF